MKDKWNSEDSVPGSGAHWVEKVYKSLEQYSLEIFANEHVGCSCTSLDIYQKSDLRTWKCAVRKGFCSITKLHMMRTSAHNSIPNFTMHLTFTGCSFSGCNLCCRISPVWTTYRLMSSLPGQMKIMSWLTLVPVKRWHHAYKYHVFSKYSMRCYFVGNTN